MGCRASGALLVRVVACSAYHEPLYRLKVSLKATKAASPPGCAPGPRAAARALKNETVAPVAS